MSNELRSLIRDTIVPAAPVIADAFYDSMESVPKAAVFLESELVNRRLRPALAQWVVETFSALSESEVEACLERQAEIGLVHARIGVPISLVARGMGILKRECSRLLEATDLDRRSVVAAIGLTYELLDGAMTAINESYLMNLLDHERNDQSLRLHVISHNLAIECERLRSELFDWMRRNLLFLYGHESEGGPALASLQQSELGLWLVHKAELLFPDLAEVGKLRAQIERVDDALSEAAGERALGLTDQFRIAVSEFDSQVSQTAWLLSSLVEHALEAERARDPLTRLLSRRYLPSILQREVKLSIEGSVPFGVLLVDIDRFKRLNDSHGHGAGDRVLARIGEIMLATMRANDFVFRYGGEEFLAVVGHSSEAASMEVAERLRTTVEAERFESIDGEELRVTVSAGVALHEGHPDYRHVIERADRALMEAKSTGRNRCVYSSPVLV